MKTKLPYEDALQQQFEDLPLPGENQSWQQMEQLLNKDKKRFLPPFFLQYGLLCLLALWFVTVMYFVLRKNEMMNKRLAEKEAAINHVVANNQEHFNDNKKAISEPKMTETAETKEAEAKEHERTAYNNEPTQLPNATSEENKEQLNVKSKGINKETKQVLTSSGNEGIVSSKQPQSVGKIVASSIKRKVKRKGGKAIAKDVLALSRNGINVDSKQAQTFSEATKAKRKINTNKAVATDKITKANQTIKIKPKANEQNEMNLVKNNSGVTDNSKNTNEQKAINNDVHTISPANKQPVIVADSLPATGNNISTIPITKTEKKDTTTIQKTTTIASAIKIPKGTNGLLWSAGAGVQQQIPVGGQMITGYGKSGNTNALADYIPSVYLRMEKLGKWFAQAEFSYGAPQPVNEFSFKRKSVLDNNFTTITTTTVRLKKTYYHQMPLSFNYYILPKWSVGVGGMYSLLQRAVAEQEISTKNRLNEQLAFSTQVMPIKGFTDSFLYKSQLHWLLQTDYQLGKFSFGIRYTRDVQPYIKYTLPNGEMDERKNWSLDFLVRFRLWQSGNVRKSSKH